MLNSVKEHVQGDDATRALNSMIEKTERLVVQFRVVKKQVCLSLTGCVTLTGYVLTVGLVE